MVADPTSISNLKSNAAEIINSLRDTIWAFNKESITLTGISDRIKSYRQKIQPAYPQVQSSVKENINKEKKLSRFRRFITSELSRKHYTMLCATTTPTKC